MPHQDLVIAVDSSGSVRSDGLNILQNFALDLVAKYQAQYFGGEAVKVGLIDLEMVSSWMMKSMYLQP